MNNCVSNVFPDAVWLLNRDVPATERDRRTHFRREIYLPEIPESVKIRVTADARYSLWINDQWVHHGPARGYQTHWPWDEIEISGYLRTGKNVLAALLYQYGSSNYSYIFQGSSGFLLSGMCGDVNLGTGDDWRLRDAPGYFPAAGKAAGQYAYQEFFDCRSGDDQWRSVDYQLSAEWRQPRSADCRAVGAPPWTDFEPRQIPLLNSEIRVPETVRRLGKIISGSNWRDILPLKEYLTTDSFDWSENDGSITIFDFQSEAVGHLIIDLDSDTDGGVVDFFTFEAWSEGHPELAVNGVPLYGGRLILRSGGNHHEVTLPWGMRSVMLVNRSAGRLDANIRIRETVYPLEISGTLHFKSDSADDSAGKLINAVWHQAIETQTHCMLDAYVDGPWRECAQWWGDALIQARNSFALSCDDRLLVRGQRQVAEQPGPNGLTYGVVPSMAPHCVLPDYSAIWLSTLKVHYQQTGSLELYKSLTSAADGIIGYFEQQITDGLVKYDSRYWLFVDWCDNLDKVEPYNLFVICGLDDVAALAELAGDCERALRCRRIADRIAGSLKLSEPSPHAAALAILSGRFGEREQELLESQLLPLLASNRCREIIPSPYFMYYIFEAAMKLGRKREVLDCICRWWGDFLAMGLPTTPEKWPEYLSPGVSRCHAWSAHVLVFLQEILLGVRQKSPGWTEVEFEPLMTPGCCASGVVPTPHGDIRVSWDWRNAEPVREIILPEGIKLTE